MPNWTYNRIYYKTKEDLNTILTKFCDEDQNFDFNKIIPMPDFVKNSEAGSRYYSQIAKYLVYEYSKNHQLRLTSVTAESFIQELYPDLSKNDISDSLNRHETFNSNSHLKGIVSEIDKLTMNKPPKIPTTDDPDLTTGKANLDSLLYTKFTNWYDWSCAYWGTKWNACDTRVKDNFLAFDTAWSPPDDEIFRKISESLKDPIYVCYTEEQITAFAGEQIFYHGECLDEQGYCDPADPGMMSLITREFGPNYIKLTDDGEVLDIDEIDYLEEDDPEQAEELRKKWDKTPDWIWESGLFNHWNNTSHWNNT